MFPDPHLVGLPAQVKEEDVEVDDAGDADDDGKVERQMTVWPMRVTLSAELGISDLQSVLESSLVRRGAHTHGPPPGRRIVLFVDDVHAAREDDYGNKECLELLRQVTMRSLSPC